MSANKYNRLSIQHKEIYVKSSNKKLPSIKTRAISLGNPTKKFQLNNILPHNPVANEKKKMTKQVSAVNMKSRKQTLSVKNSLRNEPIGFDNQIFMQQRSKSVKKNHELPGLSREEMIQRRESHLNTYFNIRKSKLQEITKQNKRIYVRINSQKSIYQSRHNKSTDSVTNSRLSNNSSRHSIQSFRKSTKSKTNLKKAITKKEEANIKIQSKDINKLESNEVNRYLNIFCNHLNSNFKANKKEIKLEQNEKGKQNKDYRYEGLGKILQQLENKKQPKKRQVFGRLI